MVNRYFHSGRALLFALSFCFSLFSFAQNEELDSLWGVWNSKEYSDSSRLYAINKMSVSGLVFSQPDSSIKLAQLQYDLANEIGDLDQKGNALNLIGSGYYVKGDYVNAIGYYEQAQEIFKKANDARKTAGTNLNLGSIYLNKGYYPKAIKKFEAAEKVFDEINYASGKAAILANLGSIYYQKDDDETALKYYEEGLRISQENNLVRREAGAYLNISNILENQGKDSLALDYVYRAELIFKDLEDSYIMSAIRRNEGNLLLKLGEVDKALEAYYASLEVSKKVGNQLDLMEGLTRIGNVYLDQSRLSEATDYCARALKIAEEEDAITLQKKACECLYDVFKAKGDGTEALVYLEKIKVIEDTLKAQETTKKLQQMEFEKALKADSLRIYEENLAIEAAHQQEVAAEKKNRNFAIVGVVFLLVLSASLYWRWNYVRKAKDEMEVEKDRSENILLNILPAEIAEELKEKGRADARDFDMVSILFTDFKDFTSTSEKLSPQQLVSEINTCFEAFDGIMEKHGVEKIKTIGDAYMAAGGLPVPKEDSVRNTVLAALEMQAFIGARKEELAKEGKPGFDMRVGVHTGPVVAGIVGVKKFQYDIWGDTVNTASRLESSGEVGKVNISSETFKLIKDDEAFHFENRGKIEVKGKGELDMLFVERKA